MKRNFIALLVVILICLVIFSCSKDDPVGPNPQPPEILAFTATPSKIIQGNSSILKWVVKNADIIKISPPGETFSGNDSGQTEVSPSTKTIYVIVASNQHGADTAALEVNVASSFLLSSLNGDIFKAEMGTNQINPAVTFKLTDSAGSNVVGENISLQILKGDGTLASNTIQTNANGEAALNYTFDGDLGHAEIKAKFSNFDSTTVKIRADMIKFGNSGQMQFMRLDDRFQDIVRYDGQPDSVDLFTGDPDNIIITVASYEASLGIVVLLYDIQNNDLIYDTSSIYAIIAVDSIFIQPDNSTSHRYEGATTNGIGIGSVYRDDIVPYLGESDSIYLDNSDPELSTVIITYINQDESETIFWCHALDSMVYQMDIYEKFGISTPNNVIIDNHKFGRIIRNFVKEK